MKKLYIDFMRDNGGKDRWGDGQYYDDNIFMYIFLKNPKIYREIEKEIEILLSNY